MGNTASASVHCGGCAALHCCALPPGSGCVWGVAGGAVGNTREICTYTLGPCMCSVALQCSTAWCGRQGRCTTLRCSGAHCATVQVSGMPVVVLPWGWHQLGDCTASLPATDVRHYFVPTTDVSHYLCLPRTLITICAGVYCAAMWQGALCGGALCYVAVGHSLGGVGGTIPIAPVGQLNCTWACCRGVWACGVHMVGGR